MTDRELLEMALEALEIECRMYEAIDSETGAPYNILETINALRARLAEPDLAKVGEIGVWEDKNT